MLDAVSVLERHYGVLIQYNSARQTIDWPRGFCSFVCDRWIYEVIILSVICNRDIAFVKLRISIYSQALCRGYPTATEKYPFQVYVPVLSNVTWCTGEFWRTKLYIHQIQNVFYANLRLAPAQYVIHALLRYALMCGEHLARKLQS